MTPRPLATLAEVAEYLRVSDKTLRNWIKRGYGPQARRIGNEIRYRWDEVEAWADAQTMTGDEDDEDDDPKAA